MIKYFISYEDLLEDNKLNRDIDFDSKELHIIRKNNEGNIRIEPLNTFSEFKASFDKLIQKNNYNKKGILLVELTEEEKDLFDSILIKSYEKQKDGTYKKIYQKDTIINLINYDSFVRMRPDEIKQGEVIAMMPCVDDPKNMYISLDREKVIGEYNFKNRRRELNKLDIGCDIYFHTNNDILLERYKDSITKIKEKKFHCYELVEHKVFVIDSLSQDRMIDWTYPTINLFDNICYNSIPVCIKEETDNKYRLDIHEIDSNEKKGYIITRDINTILYDKSIEPILKYINVYVLVNGDYVKISLCDYLEKRDILKYIKKPNYDEK